MKREKLAWGWSVLTGLHLLIDNKPFKSEEEAYNIFLLQMFMQNMQCKFCSHPPLEKVISLLKYISSSLSYVHLKFKWVNKKHKTAKCIKMVVW